jgi:hypothetical protein
MKKTALIGKVRMYSSTSALLSKFGSPRRGSEDQIRSSTPDAMDASAIALPWATSAVALAVSQSILPLSDDEIFRG